MEKCWGNFWWIAGRLKENFRKVTFFFRVKKFLLLYSKNILWKLQILVIIFFLIFQKLIRQTKLLKILGKFQKYFKEIFKKYLDNYEGYYKIQRALTLMQYHLLLYYQAIKQYITYEQNRLICTGPLTLEQRDIECCYIMAIYHWVIRHADCLVMYCCW